MANFIYDSAREKFLNGEISWLADDIRAALIKNNLYVGNSAAEVEHSTVQDILNVNAQAILQISQSLQGKSSSKGLAYSSPVVFNDVQPGEITSIILFKQGVSNLQSFLIAHIDVYLDNEMVQDVTIQWNTTGNKIFKL